jgi:MinD-like ATPase involved in chromosome partitioning or flagellar assembly
LLAEVSRLRDVDFVVIDAGCSANRVVDRFWKSAHRVLQVTTSDSASVLDAYAALKSVGSRYAAVPVEVVMNKVSDAHAHAAWCRLATASRRFLQRELTCSASIPYSHDVKTAAERAMPFVLSSPSCQTTQIVNKLVETELEGSQLEKSEQLIHVAQG